MNSTTHQLIRLGPMCLLGFTLSACEPISLTVASIGASAGMSHTLGGIIYKTFTAPQRVVETASVQALQDMGIQVVSNVQQENGETIIKAKAKERDIRILLEPITPHTTSMRATASSGLLMDSATATEIVLQTERVLIGA